MTKCLLFTEKCVVLKYCFMFIALGLDTSSQSSRAGPQRGSGTSVKTEASLSVVDDEVIKPSVKLRQSNIKHFK